MVRELRVEYGGALYQVVNRGDRRESVSQDDADRQAFLETLAEDCAKTEWQIHACCLMGNPFHLVLETPQAKARRIVAEEMTRREWARRHGSSAARPTRRRSRSSGDASVSIGVLD